VGLRPPADFHRARLNLTPLSPHARYGRIYHQRYPDPLGYGKTPSRFSDPRRKRKPETRFGVLYLGVSLGVCFVEAVLRDKKNGVVGDFPISESELHSRQYAEIEIGSTLNVVDLTGNGAIQIGMPSDVLGRSVQAAARYWSFTFYIHPAAPDGIMYPSRLNGETILAIYDRAVSKLAVIGTCALINATGLPAVLNDLGVSLVSCP
jgi:hypothetical protein